MRAILYARTSGDDRGKGNIESQLDICREYARGKGYEVVEEVHEDDRGASGADLDLPGVNRFLDLAEAHGFDVLICREMDRLARDLGKQLAIERKLKRSGLRLEYAIETYDDSPAGEMARNMRAVVAQFIRADIRLKTRRGRRNRVLRGGVLVAGRPPYGYRAEREGDEHSLFRLVPEPTEAKVVRMIFSQFSNGKSINGLAEHLAQLGINTPAELFPMKAGRRKKRGPAEWSRATLRLILRNSTYAGTWHYRDVEEPVPVPSLVGRDVWEAAQDRLESNRHNGARPTKGVWLLRGLVTCARCGHRVIGKSIKRGRYLYYICPGTGKQLGRVCSAKMVRADALDATAWEWVRGALQDPDALADAMGSYAEAQAKTAAPVREQLALVQARLEQERASLARLLDLYLAGEFDRASLSKRKAGLERTMRNLESEEGMLEQALAEREVSPEGLRKLQATARQLSSKLRAASNSAKTKRLVVEALQVRGQLAWENGEPILHVRGVLGEADRPVEKSI